MKLLVRYIQVFLWPPWGKRCGRRGSSGSFHSSADRRCSTRHEFSDWNAPENTWSEEKQCEADVVGISKISAYLAAEFGHADKIGYIFALFQKESTQQKYRSRQEKIVARLFIGAEAGEDIKEITNRFVGRLNHKGGESQQ